MSPSLAAALRRLWETLFGHTGWCREQNSSFQQCTPGKNARYIHTYLCDSAGPLPHLLSNQLVPCVLSFLPALLTIRDSSGHEIDAQINFNGMK